MYLLSDKAKAKYQSGLGKTTIPKGSSGFTLPDLTEIPTCPDGWYLYGGECLELDPTFPSNDNSDGGDYEGSQQPEPAKKAEPEPGKESEPETTDPTKPKCGDNREPYPHPSLSNEYICVCKEGYEEIDNYCYPNCAPGHERDWQKNCVPYQTKECVDGWGYTITKRWRPDRDDEPDCDFSLQDCPDGMGDVEVKSVAKGEWCPNPCKANEKLEGWFCVPLQAEKPKESEGSKPPATDKFDEFVKETEPTGFEIGKNEGIKDGVVDVLTNVVGSHQRPTFHCQYNGKIYYSQKEHDLNCKKKETLSIVDETVNVNEATVIHRQIVDPAQKPKCPAGFASSINADTQRLYCKCPDNGALLPWWDEWSVKQNQGNLIAKCQEIDEQLALQKQAQETDVAPGSTLPLQSEIKAETVKCADGQTYTKAELLVQHNGECPPKAEPSVTPDTPLVVTATPEQIAQIPCPDGTVLHIVQVQGKEVRQCVESKWCASRNENIPYFSGCPVVVNCNGTEYTQHYLDNLYGGKCPPAVSTTSPPATQPATETETVPVSPTPPPDTLPAPATDKPPVEVRLKPQWLDCWDGSKVNVSQGQQCPASPPAPAPKTNPLLWLGMAGMAYLAIKRS